MSFPSSSSSQSGTSPLNPPSGTSTTFSPSAPIAPTSPSHPSHPTPVPPFRPIFIGLLVACPLLAALPPRKLDMYSFLLASAWVVSAEELAIGRGSARWQDQSRKSAPTEADHGGRSMGADAKAITLQTQVQRQQQIELEDGAGVMGLVKRLWYGREGPGWKERRMKEEREALEEGRGYGGLIGDAVREVFGGSVGREDVERFNEERKRWREEEKEKNWNEGR
ncbi:MAG: hypothetical protein LQ352_005044 [Teloschistes flavicans]|nr:MAG: hypothetical protein LQ352_005044 [Teloschistes flavicans]